jgi:hypothetical protein
VLPPGSTRMRSPRRRTRSIHRHRARASAGATVCSRASCRSGWCR